MTGSRQKYSEIDFVLAESFLVFIAEKPHVFGTEEILRNSAFHHIMPPLNRRAGWINMKNVSALSNGDLTVDDRRKYFGYEGYTPLSVIRSVLPFPHSLDIGNFGRILQCLRHCIALTQRGAPYTALAIGDVDASDRRLSFEEVFEKTFHTFGKVIGESALTNDFFTKTIYKSSSHSFAKISDSFELIFGFNPQPHYSPPGTDGFASPVATKARELMAEWGSW